MRRRSLLGLLVAVCALFGAWAAPRVAGPVTYVTDVGALRFQLAASSPGDRGVSLFVPVANWGLRAPVIGAPVKLSVEPRAVDRDAVARAVSGGGDAEVALLRQDLEHALRRLAVRTVLLMLAGALAGGLLAAVLWHAAGVRGRRLLLAPAAAVGRVAVVLGGLGRWAGAVVGSGAAGAPGLLRVGRRARAHPRPGPRAAPRGRQVLRPGELVDPLDRRPARRPRRGRAAPAAAATERVVLASDIHNNLLTLPTVRRYSEGHLTILDGDFTINGGKMEAPLLKGVATLGDPTVAVSGNHDSPGIMRSLERSGATVLDHTDGVRTIAGLKLAAFEDPLEFEGESFPSGLRTGLSFGDLPDGHERYLQAVQERWEWFKALPERPHVLIVHQEAIGRALANLIWEADPDGAPLAILVAHTHVQRLDRYGPITTVNSGTAGAGGVFGAGTQSVGLALMDFDKATGALAATDLVQMNPSTSAARAQRVITKTPGLRRAARLLPRRAEAPGQ